jgi:hypothetical protein
MEFGKLYNESTGAGANLVTPILTTYE